MIGFRDASGDCVEGGATDGEYLLECFRFDEEGGIDYLPMSLSPDMARALAAELLAFADSSQENER